jgi:hypothetical protein
VLVAQLGPVCREVRDQHLPVCRPAHRVAQGVEAQGDPDQTQIGREETGGQRDHLDVDIGIVGAEDLDAELMVLSVATGLGSLVAKAGGDVPRLERQRRTVLRVCPHDRCSAFGTERHASGVLVLELVHLLAHDVGGLAQPVEHAELLERRAHHQPVTGTFGTVGERGDERLPPGRLRREDVVGTLRRAEGGHPRRLPSPLQVLGAIADR